MSNQNEKEQRQADPVLQFNDERLRQVSPAVPEALFDSAELNDWVARLNQSRIVYGGIGIAGPQIGLFQRLVVIDIPAHERPGFGQVEAVPFHALVNPEIVWFSDEDKLKAAEGCLSVKGYEGFVVRPRRIGLVAYTPEGKRIEFEADSLYARALQHEIDHLDGILYVDRVATLRDLRKVQPVEADDPVLGYNRYIPRPDLTLAL
jgi:peptide deformylase